jgi:hypothetical protein
MTRSSRIAPASRSRAQASAVRLAADPPLTRTPEASGGYPIHSANQPSTVSSSCVMPAPPAHQQLSRFRALEMRSPMALGQVVKPGTKAR